MKLQCRAVEPAVAEVILPAGQAELLELGEIRLAQVILAPPQQIEPLRPLLAQLADGGVVIECFFLLFCFRHNDS